jgi:hypothetical protein
MIVAGQRLPILIATRPPLAHARMRCRAAGGLSVWPSGFGTDGADRVEARPAFGDHGDLPIQTWRQIEDLGLGRHRNGADLQGIGAGQICLAEGSGRDDATVAGAV